jgi:ParB family chromosome partitioning protein
MVKNKGLGRGLDALLSNDEDVIIDNQDLRMLPIDILSPGKYQPRSYIDKTLLKELAESIKSQGIMQPILVRKIDSSKYEIVAGERRWQAARIAKLEKVPVLIKDVSDVTALQMALIENIQRENLNVIEEARGIKKLTEEFGMTHDSAADALGKSRTAISNILRLLNLSEYVQKAILDKKIDMGHARALLTLTLSDQVMLCNKIIVEKLSVRDVEKIVSQEYKVRENTGHKNKKSSDIKVLEDELSEKLGLTVNINHKNNGKGTLKISYLNLEQLDIILNKLK